MSAIFLDRDGVIMRKAPEGAYVRDWSEVDFLPGAVEAIASFCSFGYKLIVVTNQRGVATGQIQPSKLRDIHTRMREVILKAGGDVLGIYCCTHDKSDNCTCRKPRPGMLLRAASEHQLYLPDCWIVGDTATDIAAGKSVRCRTALITATREHKDWIDKPDICARSLKLVAREILRAERRIQICDLAKR